MLLSKYNLQMEFLSKEIEAYCNQFTQQESSILAKINRETHLKVLMPRMLSGHYQGVFLTMVSCMIQPMNILEIGTFTGYSAICLANGLKKGGTITTLDINKELEKTTRANFEQANVANLIDYKLGNALELIPTLNKLFDLVFIDADKENYCNYYDLIFDKVKPGGFILADNVLWSGKVLLENDKKDKDTLAVHKFNEKIQYDNRVTNILLPIRDGLMLIQKNKNTVEY